MDRRLSTQDVQSPAALRFPAHPSKGLREQASSPSICRQFSRRPRCAASSRSTPRTIWAPAVLRIGRWTPSAETIPFRCTACACRSATPHPLDKAHLERFGRLVERYEPALVSEHLAWSTHETAYFNDLLPLPYSAATLATVCDHIDEVQEAIGRRMLLENPSTYVAFRESTMSEIEFIRSVARRTGCGLLLDVNNVFVSAANHGFSAREYLAHFPLSEVREIHLAGHSEQSDDEGDRLIIDSHDGPVADAVWKLYEIVIAKAGPLPTLIEWDSNIPEWPVLRAEAAAAQAILDRFAAPIIAESSNAA